MYASYTHIYVFQAYACACTYSTALRTFIFVIITL